MLRTFLVLNFRADISIHSSLVEKRVKYHEDEDLNVALFMAMILAAQRSTHLSGADRFSGALSVQMVKSRKHFSGSNVQSILGCERPLALSAGITR